MTKGYVSHHDFVEPVFNDHSNSRISGCNPHRYHCPHQRVCIVAATRWDSLIIMETKAGWSRKWYPCLATAKCSKRYVSGNANNPTQAKPPLDTHLCGLPGFGKSATQSIYSIFFFQTCSRKCLSREALYGIWSGLLKWTPTNFPQLVLLSWVFRLPDQRPTLDLAVLLAVLVYAEVGWILKPRIAQLEVAHFACTYLIFPSFLGPWLTD